MKLNWWLLVTVLCLVLLGGEGQTLAQRSGPDPAKLGTVERDVVFCQPQGVAQKLDVYYPQQAAGLLPVAMYVHGGGWRSGDKSGGAGLQDLPELRARGYLVVSVNYRLAPEYQFPAMIEDVQCAVRYLRSNADLYGLDPDRIGAWGGSAGGHLVALLGTADEKAGFQSNEYVGQSSRVQAVVDLFGPVDLPSMYNPSKGALFNAVFGMSDVADEALIQASPTTWISPDDPPFLLLHGELDPVVPLEQSEIFLDLLRQAKVPAELVVVKNAGHGFKPVGGLIEPSRQALSRLIGDFFDRHLKD